MATLLAWLNEPEMFEPPVDVKALLDKHSKAELVDLLLDAFAIFPDLVDDLDVEQKEIPLDNPERVVGDVFDAMELDGRLTVEQARARLNLIARQADRLAKRGEGEPARRTYYEMVVNCVRLYTPYGHDLIGAYDIPYNFATAYVELALAQLDRCRPAIEAEVKEMTRSEYIDDLFDLMEALFDIEEALGWWVEVGAAQKGES